MSSEKTLRAGDLDRFTGSEHWYRHPLSDIITYTDGARHVAANGGAYWLLDAIVSHQLDPHVRRKPFQSWTLKVAPDCSARLVCEDGSGKLIVTQPIPFTDFPLPEITLWLIDNVIFLPNEY
jgi:hypothetical protein